MANAPERMATEVVRSTVVECPKEVQLRLRVSALMSVAPQIVSSMAHPVESRLLPVLRMAAAPDGSSARGSDV